MKFVALIACWVASIFLPSQAFPLFRSSFTTCFTNVNILKTSSENIEEDAGFIAQKGEKAKETSSSSLDKVAFLNKQAQMLRAEANSLQRAVNETKAARLAKAEKKLDTWIDDLFVNLTINDSTQIINTVEEVARVLIDGRYSPEQVDKVFERLCQTDQVDSPMMELLADATNEVDVLQREDNPNKRWNHVVERKLRKKMFAMRYGIDPDIVD